MGSRRRATDLIYRQNRRGSISPERIVYREQLPLALRNHVKGRSEKSKEKVCVTEMMAMMDCMSKYNYDKTMCTKEHQS